MSRRFGRRPGSLTYSSDPPPAPCSSSGVPIRAPGLSLSRGASDDRHHRTPDHHPRPRRRRRARPLRGRRAPLPRGRARRRRVPRLPPQPGHLRPAPGRHQPDGAGEDPVRPGRARPARDARLRRRDVLARLGPPHHAPERAVPLRRARAGRRGAAPARGRRHDEPRGVRRHRAQRRRLPPRRGVPLRGPRHQPVGRGGEGALPAQPADASGCPASSRSTSPAAPPTAARPCSTTSA